ncbi:MAG: GNAT family N-acetyltransferase [Ignavibacteria bacterium]|jgi:RimJ/RimL family protein N-acetyltransferase
MNLQPTLENELITLRPLRENDFEALYEVAKDPLIWEQHPDTERYKKENFKKLFAEFIESRGTLIVIDAKTGKVIGASRYHGYSKTKSEVEIGWTFLARAYWGGIYNKEMKLLMLKHAFKFVKNVVFLVGPENIRSQKAVEKIGGKFVGKRLDGSGHESMVYRITTDDFI